MFGGASLGDRGSLCKGVVTGLALSDRPGDYKLVRKGEFLRCPWHGWEYDLKTGACIGAKQHKLKKYETVVRSGDLYVVA